MLTTPVKLPLLVAFCLLAGMALSQHASNTMQMPNSWTSITAHSAMDHGRQSPIANKIQLIPDPGADQRKMVYWNVTGEYSKRASNPLDPAFDPPDWSNKANMVSQNGPMLRSNWDPDRCSEKADVVRAFSETLELAQAAMDYIRKEGRTGSSYVRYFGGQKPQDVINPFFIFFNPRDMNGNFVGHPVNSDFRFIDIRFDAPKGILNGLYDKECISGSGQGAVMKEGPKMAPGVVTDTRRGLICVCDDAFNILGDLPTGDEPSRCDQFQGTNNYASIKTNVLAATLLHETLHFDFMVQAVDPNSGEITDYSAKLDPLNTDQDPPNGYGSYNAMRIQQRGRNPLINADSYMWFALEAWWQKKCGITLRDPPKNSMTFIPASNFDAEPPDTYMLADGTTNEPS